jgi:hypothetical protein
MFNCPIKRAMQWGIHLGAIAARWSASKMPSESIW